MIKNFKRDSRDLNQAWGPFKHRRSRHTLCTVLGTYPLHLPSFRGLTHKMEILPTKSQWRCEDWRCWYLCGTEQVAWHTAHARLIGGTVVNVIIITLVAFSSLMVYWAFPMLSMFASLTCFNFLSPLQTLWRWSSICCHWIPCSTSCRFLHMLGTQEVFITLIFVWFGLIDRKHLCHNIDMMAPTMKLY